MKFTGTKNIDILKNVVGISSSVSITTANNCWLGLFTTMPSGVSGSGGVEPSAADNYERMEIHSMMSETYKSYSQGEASATTHTDRVGNAYNINFNVAIDPDDDTVVTGQDWGTIVGVGLFSSRTAATPYAWASLETPVSVPTGWGLRFLPGRFEISIDEIVANAST